MSSLASRVQTLSVFAGLKQDPVIAAFFALLSKADGTNAVLDVKIAYAKFVELLYGQYETDWTSYFLRQVLSLETCCTHFASLDHEIPRFMLDAAMKELEVLSKVGAIAPDYFFNESTMPKWSSRYVDLQGEYLNRLIHIDQFGFGPFTQHTAFRIDECDGGWQLSAIAHPDPVMLEDLFGYEEQHARVLANTDALLEGLPASNILLYGDAGTGKSATVKAVVNARAKQGLRLIELSKKQLRFLPAILDELSENPLKFILFIDDLSFQENDDDFSALKAVLEGSVAARSQNTVIYATSNRRHIVRETFSAREGDEVHRNDTMQETISLSERFGMNVLFEKPTLDQYKAIVRGIAARAGLHMDDRQLTDLAEQFARFKSGRSARAARQFVEQAIVNAAKQKGESEAC